MMKPADLRDLEKDAPEPRPIQAANLAEIIEIPEVGACTTITNAVLRNWNFALAHPP